MIQQENQKSKADGQAFEGLCRSVLGASFHETEKPEVNIPACNRARQIVAELKQYCPDRADALDWLGRYFRDLETNIDELQAELDGEVEPDGEAYRDESHD